MEIYEKELHIEDETFEIMRKDADMVLQRLLENMVEKESHEGQLTIKLNIGLRKKEIQKETAEGMETIRNALVPEFSFAIRSAMNIKDEIKESIDYEDMEMVYNEEKCEYVIRPIIDSYQKSIFDSDFKETLKADEETEEGSRTGSLS